MTVEQLKIIEAMCLQDPEWMEPEELAALRAAVEVLKARTFATKDRELVFPGDAVFNCHGEPRMFRFHINDDVGGAVLRRDDGIDEIWNENHIYARRANANANANADAAAATAAREGA